MIIRQISDKHNWFFRCKNVNWLYNFFLWLSHCVKHLQSLPHYWSCLVLATEPVDYGGHKFIAQLHPLFSLGIKWNMTHYLWSMESDFKTNGKPIAKVSFDIREFSSQYRENCRMLNRKWIYWCELEDPYSYIYTI